MNILIFVPANDERGKRLEHFGRDLAHALGERGNTINGWIHLILKILLIHYYFFFFFAVAELQKAEIQCCEWVKVCGEDIKPAVILKTVVLFAAPVPLVRKEGVA